MKKAFTLIELVICLLVIAVIIMFTTYQFNGLHRKKAQILMIQLQQLLTYAQLKAIEEKQPITVCPLDGHGRCDTNWNAPIAVFVDPDKKHQLLSQTQLLKIYQPRVSSQGRLTFSAFMSNRYLTLTTLGLAGFQNGTFTYCEQFGHDRILTGLSISKTGRKTIINEQDKYFQNKNLC